MNEEQIQTDEEELSEALEALSLDIKNGKENNKQENEEIVQKEEKKIKEKPETETQPTLEEIPLEESTSKNDEQKPSKDEKQETTIMFPK